MTVALAVLAFVVGVVIVIVAAERFVEGLLGSSVVLGLSTFALGVIFGGFDPDNLAVGIAGGANDLPLVALGTVLGSATFLMTAGLGLTVLVSPLRVTVPRRYLALTLAAPVPLLLLSLDDRLSRMDGIVMLALFAPLITFVVLDSRRTRTVFLAGEEFAEVEHERSTRIAWFFPTLMVGGLLAVAGGAELMVWGAEHIVNDLGFSEGIFGMLVVSAAVSFEEVVRGVLPARRGHHEVSIGNILGTVLFFVLFNVGFVSLLTPLSLDGNVRTFYWPFMMGSLVLAALLILRGRVGRPEGTFLLATYGLYVGLGVWIG